MEYAEIAVIPLLMLADYYLTLAGAKLYATRAEGRAAYELNPHFKDDIARLVLVNPRHLVFVGASIVVFVTVRALDPAVWRFFLGVGVGAFGLLVGTHIANILTGRHARAQPDDLSGQQVSSYRFKLMAAAYRVIGLAIAPLGLIALIEPRPFTLGVALGAFFLALQPVLWRANLDKAALDTKSATGRAMCGFCGRDDRTARRLLAGSGVMICDDCVATCNEALRETVAAE